MKATIILSAALFLASAPSPDSKTISEMSAGFLAPAPNRGLMASDINPDRLANSGLNAAAAIFSANTDELENERKRKL